MGDELNQVTQVPSLFTEDEPVKSVFPALEDALLALGALGYSQ